MLPIIGVMPLFDEKRNSLLMLPGYYDGITEAGGIPVMLPLSEDSRVLKQVIEQCQGLLFTGGQDVSPELYGEDPLNDTVVCCIQRDRMERIVLQEAMKLNKPILGICRGIQFIDAALGGTLYQDLPTEHPSSTEHHLGHSDGKILMESVVLPSELLRSNEFHGFRFCFTPG